MPWVWTALAAVVALANVCAFVLYGVGTDLLERPKALQVLQGLTMLALWLALAEVWVHATGAASWHSWPLMWVAPATTALQAPFRVLPDVPRWKSAPGVLLAAAVFSVPALLMVLAGRAPLP